MRPKPSSGAPFLRRVVSLPERFDTSRHPFNVKAFSHGIDLAFRTNVTFFVGENGSGKSTLLEALAECCGFSAEGGSRDHQRAVFAERSDLAQALKLSWLPKVTEGFFMRAESFYNFATYFDQVSDLRAYGGKSLHQPSHGESFLALFANRFEQGVYILDEPEAALSPQRQLAFLRIIHEIVTPGDAQFLIATHSPIILSYPGAVLFSLDEDMIREIAYCETEHYLITRDFLNFPERYFKHLFDTPGEQEGIAYWRLLQQARRSACSVRSPSAWVAKEKDMAKYRNALPQLGGDFFMTDGGIETTLIFLDGQDLPHFAAFHLFTTPEGKGALRKYFRTYGELAKKLGTGLILETATWRSNPDWGEKLGYGADALGAVARESVRLLEEIRAEFEAERVPIVISGCIGPRGDGYVPDRAMSEREAQDYHRPQVDTFADTAADLVTAITMNYAEEAVGVAQAAKQANMPVVISFTVETDGRLPTGQSLGDAVQQVDDATSEHPAYFMINCAHPSHFEAVIRGDERWAARIRGLRANASSMSHAQLNEAPELDAGNPTELAREYDALRKQKLKRLNVMGGCCGTDHRHIERIALACLPAFRGATQITLAGNCRP